MKTATAFHLAAASMIALSLSFPATGQNKAVDQAGTPTRGKDWTVPELGIEFVYVKPGVFKMGSSKKYRKGGEWQKPRHKVDITRRLWVGKYEVTLGQYRKFLQHDDNSVTFDWTAPSCPYRKGEEYALSGNRFAQAESLPVTHVSWNDANKFCKWLTERERTAGRLPDGYVFRLPTEAEWEYVARGGQQGEEDYKFSGDKKMDKVGWYQENSDGRPHKVGQKKPNVLRIHDMSGNVWEWCLDWYDKKFYEKSPREDPVNREKTGKRMTRGGGWSSSAQFCTVRRRSAEPPGTEYQSVGFRVVLAPRLRGK